jgi:hypothetical protein
MASSKSVSSRQSSTGSYTVSVHRSATSGKFVSTPKSAGKIVTRGSDSKSSK